MDRQMTHFPALASEADDSNLDMRVAKNSRSNGIINSIFGSFFRGNSTATTSEATHAHVDESYLKGENKNTATSANPQMSLAAEQQLSNNHVVEEIEISEVEAMESSDRNHRRLSNGDLKNYKQSEFRRYWMPDATGRECYECHEKFYAFRRRHHCRLCGQIFCGRCSSHQINGAELGYSGVLRLCSYCANQVDSHVNDRQKKSVYEPAQLLHFNYSQTNLSKRREIKIDLPSQFSENLLRKATGELPNNNDFPMRKADQNSSTSLHTTTSEPTAKNHDIIAKRFERNTEKMLDDIMRRENLDSKFWRDLLLTLSATIVESVYSQVLREPNALNLLDFVHIKKIPSTLKPEFEIVHGVTFSKTLAHKSMPSSTENASIMLLSGSISYERVVEKLSSLEQIILQEREYLKTQVERVTSKRISLLFVENSVSQLALQMLLDAGVGVVTNVRHKVLERVARATNSDIISSLDAQFLQPRIGFASDFSQREFKLVDGQNRKSVLMLDQCSGGLSVLLYGKSIRELIVAKRVLKFLLILRYSSRLETEFLRMFNALPIDNSTLLDKGDIERGDSNLNMKDLLTPADDKSCQRCELCEQNRMSEAPNDLDPSEFVRLMRNTQLTNSPAIRYAPPYFETSAGRNSDILPYFRRPLFQFLDPADVNQLSDADEDACRHIDQTLRDYKDDRRKNKSIRHCMLDDEKVDPNALTNASRLSSFRIQSWFPFRRRYELNCLCNAMRTESLKSALALQSSIEAKRRADLLNAYNRQRIPFLYCANSKKVSSNARTFCMGPYVLLRQFYEGQDVGHKDTSLGVFLMNYCFNNDYKCSSCERSMIDHFRRIVHRNARIEIVMHILPKSNIGTTSAISVGSLADDLCLDGLPSSIPNMNCSLIICWRRCPKCGANSCSIPLPSAVYHMSFAKFIDYLSNGTYWISMFPTGNFGEICRHCTFHEHVHYFAYHNLLASFRVCPIHPLHVALNPMICSIDPKEMSCRELIEAHYDLNSSASDAFDSAISFFKNIQQSTSCGLTTASESLLSFVEQIKATFSEQMGNFDPDGIFKQRKVINSNDPYYAQSEACLMHCRYLLNAFITKWNSSKLDVVFVAPSIVPNDNISDAVDTSKIPIKITRTDSSEALSISGCNDSLRNLLGNYNRNASHNIELLAVSSSNSISALVNLNSTYLSEMTAVQPEFHFSVKEKSAHSRKSSFGTTPHFQKNDRNPSHSNVSTIDNRNVTSAEEMKNSSYLTLPSELPDIANTLPKNLHFELPSNNFVIRDLIEGKAMTPDVASIIGYTLSMPAYKERKLNKGGSDNTYWELSFGNDAKSKYNVKVYFAEEFEALRNKLFGDGEMAFIRSLSRSTAWHPQGGKSGANFFRTEDERFIIKQMLRLELESFKKFGTNYCNYVKKAFDGQKLTSLCKIYGVFSINITGKTQPSFKIDVLVMEYLFYKKNVKQVWDLKGSLRNRTVLRYASTKNETPVLLDENLVEDLWGNQLYVDQHSKMALSQAITNDLNFLKAQGIMDYSLLAGVCQDEVVIGIVDYVRTFTLDKKVESLVKNALPMTHTSTVLNPELYCKRFYEAINGYFAVAPDQWTTTSTPDAAALLQNSSD